MDLKEKARWGSVIALFILGALLFSNDNGLAGSIAFIIAIYFVFSSMKQSQTQNKLDKVVLIQTLQAYMENYLKISIDDGSGLRHLYDYEGDPNWKFVFFIKSDGETKYYPCTIDKFSGQVGEMTGTIWTDYEEVKSWVTKDLSKNSGFQQDENMLKTIKEAVSSEFRKVTGVVESGTEEPEE